MKIEQTNGEPRFTFDEVKDMIEKLLLKQNNSGQSVTASLKRVEFDDIAPQGHSIESCKDLLEELVQNTRRIRTLREVLIDIKDNLKKSRYTEIIARSAIKGDLPKKPASAYLLYHADRYNELKKVHALAVDISKAVSEEWWSLSEKKRRHYHRKQEEMMADYEEKMRDLGLIDDDAPKRPKSAKQLYIDHCMGQLNLDEWSREDISSKREKLGIAFDSLNPEDKKYWLQLMRENQEKYLSERQAYIDAHPHLSHEATSKKPRTTSDKLKFPDPPRSAVKFYIARKMPEDVKPDQLDETIKFLKEQFSTLRDKKQLKYIKKAIQDKARYDREVEQFNKHYPNSKIRKYRTNLTKEQMKIYSKIVERRPDMPAPTAYLYYCGKILTDMMNNDDSQAPTSRMKTASEAWRKLSSKERKAAIRMHTEDMERYVNDMDRWLAAQSEERKSQILTEEPKANPDYWRKKLNRIKKRAIKQEKEGIHNKIQNGVA